MITLPKFPYSYDSFEPVISKETMELHFEKHHIGYVKNLNNLIEETELEKETDPFLILENLFKLTPEKFLPAKNNLGGHLNHNFFWKIMKPNNSKGKNSPSLFFTSEIKKIWGSFEKFENLFKDNAISLFGSGWTWCIYNKNSKKLEIKNYSNQDTPYYNKMLPILGIDLWEHAYYNDYKNLKLRYIENWWNIINWGFVENNYTEILKNF